MSPEAGCIIGGITITLLMVGLVVAGNLSKRYNQASLENWLEYQQRKPTNKIVATYLLIILIIFAVAVSLS